MIGEIKNNSKSCNAGKTFLRVYSIAYIKVDYVSRRYQKILLE